jgi:hypothetical protein
VIAEFVFMVGVLVIAFTVAFSIGYALLWTAWRLHVLPRWVEDELADEGWKR